MFTHVRRMAATFAALSLLMSLSFGGASAETNEPREPDVLADGAVLMEAGTREVLYSQSAHDKCPMASTTKVMTALIALERCDLDEYVEVPAEASGVEGSSMYLAAGERITMRDLLYGLMLVSGNDAAVAIAIHIAGSVEAFAELMNERAREIGAFNTNFVTPNGLHNEQHYTTAYDLALIACKAMENADFRSIVSTQYYHADTGRVKRTLKNKNKILWEYDGGNGIKTGYTLDAGKCLVFAAKRDDMQLVGVLLNCRDLFPSAEALLDYGFSAYAMQNIVGAGDTVARVRVSGSEKSILALTVNEDIIVPVKCSASAVIRTSVSTDKDISAPVEAGATLGKLEISEGSRLICSVPLVAVESVGTASYKCMLIRLMESWTA